MSNLSPLVALLRCIECGGPLAVAELSESPGHPELGPDGRLDCRDCRERYPIVGGTPRMLGRRSRARLEDPVGRRTAESFAYEWRRFGARGDYWARNFEDYMRPHPAGFLDGRLVLDVGAGSGRHSFEAARVGARVVAVDLGQAIDVARRNLPDAVLTVQADAERLPFAPATFDFVMSIGVLHHLPDPERSLGRLVPLAKPGGIVHVYLYWLPPHRTHRALLRLVSLVRRVSVRLPHRVVHLLSYPLAGALHVAVVEPQRALRNRPRGRALASRLPLKTYADYPFGVLVGDQFDRFSAPLEHRYERSEVRELLIRCGLVGVRVEPHAGWLAHGFAP